MSIWNFLWFNILKTFNVWESLFGILHPFTFQDLSGSNIDPLATLLDPIWAPIWTLLAASCLLLISLGDPGCSWLFLAG